MLYHKTNICFVLFVSVLNLVNSAKILCWYPIPFDSHMSVFKVISEQLALAGHHVTVLKSQTKTPWARVTEINHPESYEAWDQLFPENCKHCSLTSTTSLEFWKAAHKTMLSIMDQQLNVTAMQVLMRDKNQHFDLVIVEDCARASLAIGAISPVPIISVSSFYGIDWGLRSVGASVDFIFYPDFLYQTSWNLCWWEKLRSLYAGVRHQFLNKKTEKADNAFIRKHFGDEAPNIAELKRRVQLLVLNVHHVWDDNRPVPPSVIYTGALHLEKPKKLKGDLKKFCDSSTNGVIYMSFGSKFKSSDLPSKTLEVIVKVFASLPYDIIWKWNGGHLPEKPKNVLLEQWLPQNDLLNHPKVKGFITHGGLQSTDEAIAARVPLVGLPLMVDQKTNCVKYEQHGIGVCLDLNTITYDEFRRGVISIAEDESTTSELMVHLVLGDFRRPWTANTLEEYPSALSFLDMKIKDLKSTCIVISLATLSFKPKHSSMEILLFRSRISDNAVVPMGILVPAPIAMSVVSLDRSSQD